GANPEQPAILLHHVDPGPAVACIDHQPHRAPRSEDIAKGAQAVVRVGHMVEHAGADDQVEGARQAADILDRETMEFEVIQIVLALKITRVTQARFAYVDRGDPCRSRPPGSPDLRAGARSATSGGTARGDAADSHINPCPGPDCRPAPDRASFRRSRGPPPRQRSPAPR